MTSNDMVFSYIYENDIRTKICGDPVKTNTNILCIYNINGYTMEETDYWLSLMKNTFHMFNFNYGFAKNTEEDYCNVIKSELKNCNLSEDNLTSSYNTLNTVSYENSNILLYIYLPDSIPPNFKYLIFSVLRYGICQHFRKLKETILYLHLERNFNFWKAIYFSHYCAEANLVYTEIQKNKYYFSHGSCLVYFCFLNPESLNFYAEIEDLTDELYLLLSKEYRSFTNIGVGSTMFRISLSPNDNIKIIDFRKVSDKEIEKFVSEFSLKNVFAYILKNMDSKQKYYLKKIYNIIETKGLNYFLRLFCAFRMGISSNSELKKEFDSRINMREITILCEVYNFLGKIPNYCCDPEVLLENCKTYENLKISLFPEIEDMFHIASETNKYYYESYSYIKGMLHLFYVTKINFSKFKDIYNNFIKEHL